MLAGDVVLEFGGESFLGGERHQRRYRACQDRIAGAPD
jgi:hypothetical protein